MKNYIILSLLLSLVAMTCLAIPAKRVRKSLTLADGTTVTATLIGDENGHWYVDDKGRALSEDSTGIAHYMTIYELDSRKRAKTQRAAIRNKARKARMMTRSIDGDTYEGFIGKKKGIAILVNFPDAKFTYTQEDFNAFANEKGYNKYGAKGSVGDYFRDQSYGKFEIEFDIVGPYELAHDTEYYGKNRKNKNGEDVRPGEMVTEAVKLADKDVNFADYDWNYDGVVDQVYIIFAGYAEEQGAPSTTIWSHEWNLTSAEADNCGGDGPVLLDNVWIDTYACSSELRGKQGKKICGIGTMCHEFSHCLGLPDFYDTVGKGFGMDSWSIMAYGAYNGDCDIPSGYTSYERWAAGWLEPVELSTTTTVTDMKALAETPEAYIIYNDANQDEFFLLENRQLTSWDEGNYGHGLLILHVDYDEYAWRQNTVNNDASHQRMSIFHADNSALLTNLAGDPYPGTSGNNSLTDNSLPSAKLFNANKDSRKYMGKPITDIIENNDSTISFTFTNPKIITGINSVSEEPKTKIYSITGQYMGTDLKKLPQGVYKMKTER